MKDFLQTKNFKVFTASDGEEGVRLAKKIIPDLIVSDVMMPKMTGHQVISELRKTEELAAIPFIFLTAKNEVSDLRTGMDLGADDYLFKPFVAAELLKAVETRLSRFDVIRLAGPGTDQPEEELSRTYAADDRLFVKINNKQHVIKVGDILCIKAAGEYSTIFMPSGEKVLVRKLMKQWEKQLPANLFVRVHRAVIINVGNIDHVEKWYNRSYVVVLRNFKERIVISQRYFSKIKSRFFLT